MLFKSPISWHNMNLIPHTVEDPYLTLYSIGHFHFAQQCVRFHRTKRNRNLKFFDQPNSLTDHETQRNQI